MAARIVFVDTEVGVEDQRIHDIGAVRQDRACFHAASLREFAAFAAGADYLCGHNILHHDLKYIRQALNRISGPEQTRLQGQNRLQEQTWLQERPQLQDQTQFPGQLLAAEVIDTLYLSPLLFPKRPYHALLKDDKLQTDQLNDPVNDARKAAALFYDEVNAFFALPSRVRQIYCGLLYPYPEFQAFFHYMHVQPSCSYVHVQPPCPDPDHVIRLIREEYEGRICTHADLATLIRHCPVELAYTLALIGTDDPASVTPPWLLRNYPKMGNVCKLLRGRPCKEGCSYCDNVQNIHRALKDIFGYESFRTYNGEPLQEMAAQAAVDGKSLLAVFPTGGGKSITFQLPALMAGRGVHGLTVVISPLQSLMKDQVDNLDALGIHEAVTVNGLLDPLERANALERVANGSASILYISPEQLRSRTIEKLLLSRTVVRFVIDEAHCFSAWGQDFRVDYLYIGDFIRELQKKKGAQEPLPVSCFTATAKQKVIRDICDYFKRKLDLDLAIFASSATRENLHYTVLYQETEEEKYAALRNLVAQKDCPTIVYVSRTKRTLQLADRLTGDGFPARPFNGKMDSRDKVANQEAFIRNEIQVIVATSAFGMGVDKKDVRLVVHYDISASLEDYVQEAGRAGRNPSLEADCYVLYNDNDLDKHFLLLNQTKLSISEIQQVWKAIKDLTRLRPRICCSPLEIARQAGWDDSVLDVETRVKTAVSALENAGYIRRGRNMPHVYASSIRAKDMQEASYRIDQSPLFSDQQRANAKRIIKSLISSRSIAKAGNDDGESRVDYLADILGMTKEEVISSVNLMRQDGLLADSTDLSAYLYASDTENKSVQILNRFAGLEEYLLKRLPDEGMTCTLKELNEGALAEGINGSSVKNLRTLLYFLTIKRYISKSESGMSKMIRLVPNMDVARLTDKFRLRVDICRFVLENLYEQARQQRQADRQMGQQKPSGQQLSGKVEQVGQPKSAGKDWQEEGESGQEKQDKGEHPVQFSLVGLHRAYQEEPSFLVDKEKVTQKDVEDALLYLSKIGALRLEGGFLVLYNGMELKRLVLDNRIKYKVDDYRLLDEFYKQKIRQIHIVGEYANLMVRDYQAALQFVQDYFQMDFQKFIAKYFREDQIRDMDRNITPQKYHQLFGELSEKQAQIIQDAESRYIVVAAGPGSGKTRVLVHKLAALLLLEDVKHEQLLMLTFSRAAATEFKKRLQTLIGNAANFVEIKTFHSYCFDLLGKIGSLEGIKDVVKNAADLIRRGEVEQGRIIKSVLVIDEAQDMDANEYNLVTALMQANEDMRVIAVGDDDQNIYEFRGSDSKYLRALIEGCGARKYEMTENYRSDARIVALANAFAARIRSRMKSAPIEAVGQEEGTLRITHHSGRHMEEAVVRELLSVRQGETCCLLTNTNDEALRLQGLLIQHGVQARLIQSLEGFRLSNLVEIRYFLRKIDQALQSPVISDEVWDGAKKKLFQTYARSTCLGNCARLIRDFETTNPAKYRTDLDEFIRESNYEDFYERDGERVYVSTIHKAKGREFDTVFLMLDGNRASTEAEKRKLYVGMTRAKHALYIHCNTPLFSGFRLAGMDLREDPREYEEPAEITLQLTHKDVVLDFFQDKKRLIFRLRSGMELSFADPYLLADVQGRRIPMVKLSKACRERIASLRTQGYQPVSARIRFVVAWKKEETQEEIPVILSDLHFQRMGGNKAGHQSPACV